MKVYEGPVLQASNVETYYSDSADLKLKLQAAKQLEFDNRDREFPEGVSLTFYSDKGQVNATLKANYGKKKHKTGIYTVEGDVVIKSYKKNKQLNTELLNWNPETQKVYTDKFVRIKTKDEILTGEGLVADQDFENYRIKNPAGEFSVQSPE